MTNFDNALNFSLLSTRDFEDRVLANEIVQTILSFPADVRPKDFGAFQPLKNEIANANDVVDVLVNKSGPKTGGRAGSLLMETGKRFSYSVQWDKGPRPSFSSIGGWIGFDFLDEKNVLSNWLESIKRLVEVLKPSYGDVNSMAVENWDTPLNLQLRLPDISPISIYGREYVELLGAKEIEAAPFLEIEKVGGCYWLVASHSLRSGVPKGRRREIREYFGEDAFMADGNWKYSTGRAPKFDLSASIAI